MRRLALGVMSIACAVTAAVLPPLTVRAAHADDSVAAVSTPESTARARSPAAEAVRQAAEREAAIAATRGVEQGVAVLDRTTGELIVSIAGDRVFKAESILKLFTAAFYLIRADGVPGQDLTTTLRTMIVSSDNGIQSDLWRHEIIPTIAQRYGVQNTSNGPNPSAGNWGSDRTTADDQAVFLYRISQDPVVGPHLMAWMAAAEPSGADGFDQSYGLYAVGGDRGVKQGWSDPGWTPVHLHSVGWTGELFVAILQVSPSATYATMRETSTGTARGIAAARASAEWTSRARLVLASAAAPLLDRLRHVAFDELVRPERAGSSTVRRQPSGTAEADVDC